MKILKYGEGYLHTTICESCKSELEYTDSDIKTDTGDHYIGTEHNGLNDFDKFQKYKTSYVICPVCGCHLNFKMKILCEYKTFCHTKKKRWWQK